MEKLVEAVKSYPCLWQVTSCAYKDIIAKINAWKEVSAIVTSRCLRWPTLNCECHPGNVRYVRYIPFCYVVANVGIVNMA